MNPASDPDISVILPTYNRGSLIKRAIKSVLQQTFANFELIVIDDCSIDCTEQEIKSISDKRIQYICHNINKGGSAARNTGLDYAKGKYISFLDDDDEYPDDRLYNLIAALENKQDCGYVFSQMLLKTREGTRLIPATDPLPFTHVDLLLGKVPSVYHTTLIRK